MDTKDLSRIDLNLLVALQILLEEGNVSRAAERLFITQSAMSKTLGRMRELFDDPLFTRQGAGMLPTPRAEEIGKHLPCLLQGVKTLVSPPVFNPAEYKGNFHISMPEFIDIWALPLLMEKLSNEAPYIDINAVNLPANQLEQMATGDLDFIIQPEKRRYPESFKTITLGFAPPRLFVRSDHPLTQIPNFTLEDAAKYQSVSLHFNERRQSQIASLVDHPAIKYWNSIKPKIETSHLYAALQIVRATDYVFAGPPLFMDFFDYGKEIVALPVPEGDDLSFKFVLVYHERVQESEPHQYMIATILECVDTWRTKHGLPPIAEMRKQRNLAS